MKKTLSTLCLGALLSFAFISCDKESSMLEPNGPQKSNANAKHDRKVTICHQTGSGSVTITVSENAVDAHVRNHGDTIGECEPMMTPE